MCEYVHICLCVNLCVSVSACVSVCLYACTHITATTVRSYIDLCSTCLTRIQYIIHRCVSKY